MNNKISALSLTTLIGFNVFAGEFNYLAYQNNTIVSQHDLPYQLKVPSDFTKIAPFDYTLTNNGKLFNVTVAVVIGNESFVMVSAETLADQSGILDYSYYPAAKLNGLDFYLRESCIPALTAEQMSQLPDVNYVNDNGFGFNQPTFLHSYFKNSEDGNTEYIVHYGEHVADCSDKTISSDFKSLFKNKVDQLIHIKEL